jgi:hypothetical protein
MSDNSNYSAPDGGVSDSFTETTSRSWMSRIGDAIKGVLIGLVLIVGSCILLFWNEGRAVQTARSLTEGAGLVVSVATARVDPANEGKLVHVTGDTETKAPLTDPEFGVSATGLRLVRAVEMFQWKEESKTETRKNLGGSEESVTTYSYHRVWSDSRVDSSRFRQPDGHVNPQMRYARYEMTARDATLGAFRPGERVLRLLPADQDVRVEPAIAERAAQRLRTNVQATDGKLYLGADPATPRLGDLRVSYKLVATGPASVIGKQTGSDLTEYQTQAGDAVLLAQPGVATAPAMFKAAQDENRLITWIVRLIGAVLIFIGFSLILRPLVVVADVVPLIGNILGAGAGLVSLLLTAIVVPLVVAIAWFWYRPLVSVGVIAAGVVVAFGLKMLAGRRSAARAGAATAA